MNGPQMLSFDIYGNMFVTEWVNNRVKKFPIVTNSCDTFTTQQTTVAITTVSHPKIILPSSIVVLPLCSNPNQIGLTCNISSAPCDILQPCQNNGSCINSNSTSYGYSCVCLSDFNGIQCQFDNQLCKTDTCQNNGNCTEISNRTFECTCQSGWTNVHCETKVNYCKNVTCLNNGICRPLLLDFMCECLGTSYSGRFCEISEQAIVIRQKISKSFAYVAISCLASVITFIIIMDVLKYFFGVDLTDNDRRELERRRKRRRRWQQRVKNFKLPKRLSYIEYSLPLPPRAINNTTISIIEETIF
ncbi:hypothetical protein I4U23_004587 [Adineta vaga]|nr:hypothetical protein I4U23_004587 [Adineta vaga]